MKNKNIIKRIIEDILKDSDIPLSSKYQLSELFTECFKKYYQKGQDIRFDSIELRDMWFYFKIKMLSMMSSEERAYYMLSKELSLNAKKYLNPKYEVKNIGGK